MTAMAAAPFGIAVIGLDHWYTAFGVLDTAAASARAPLVGIADPDAERLAAMRERYPTVTVTDDVDALLAREDAALIAIAAATDQAPGIARRALAAGKHVVSVKPPARTLAELDAVIADARRAGRFYGSFEGMQRLTPRMQLARALVQGGAIGQPMAFYQIAHGGLPAPWPGRAGDSWWLHAGQVPGGAWIDHAIYAVDAARFVFGGEIVQASAIVENRVHTDLGVEDYGAALLRLRTAAGASVSLVFEDTWTASPGSGFHRQEIIGTRGTLRPENNDWIVRSGGEETRHAAEPSPFFHLEALADILQDGGAPPFGPVDARANLAACLAVYGRG